MNILITGGAGFVGASLCRLFKQTNPADRVVAFDNLHRRGSEQNLSSFKQLGINFIHGDIRSREDLFDIPGTFDLIIEASAEPSVHAGLGDSSCDYLLQTNLVGTINSLVYARQRVGSMIFLSTSRVYAINQLRSLPLVETTSRFELANTQDITGLSSAGIAENFPILQHGFRSLYGTSKLASELLVEEYACNFNYPAIVNRCGVLAGAGQFGKTDQGVFTLWVARHVFGGALSYTGFGGTGKQVRDLLHPRDLYKLMRIQINHMSNWHGQVYGVGGGLTNSVSLQEYTALCTAVTGKQLAISANKETSPVDIPYFVTDIQHVSQIFGWQPDTSVKQIVEDIDAWLETDAVFLKPLFV